MCEYCGCRGVQPIAELMDEHTALVDEAHHVRQALGAGDRATAMSLLTHLVGHLDRHVRREEDGIFSALRHQGEFLDEVDELEGEHRDLNATIDSLDVESPNFDMSVTRLLADLDIHVERENLGIFPVSVVTLGGAGWQIVDEAHAESPSFLADPALRDSRPGVKGQPTRRQGTADPASRTADPALRTADVSEVPFQRRKATRCRKSR